MVRKNGFRKPQISSFTVLLGTVAVLYFAQEVLIPLALSVLLAFLLAPLATALERWKLGRVPAVVTVVVAALVVILAIGWVVGRQVVGLAEDLPSYQDEIVRKVKSLNGTGSGLGSKIAELGTKIEDATGQPTKRVSTTSPTMGSGEAGLPRVGNSAVQDIANDPVGAFARETVGGPPPTSPSPPGTTLKNPIFAVSLPAPVSPIKTLATYLGLVLGPLGTVGLIVVFVAFILLERQDLRDRMIHLISRGKYTLTTRALNDAGSRISRYILAQSIVNGSYGVVVTLGLWIIGLTLGHGSIFPSFVLWGLVCAVLRFVPYVGPSLAATFPMAVALAVYPGFGVFIAVLALIVTNELISNNIVEPWLYGASTGLSTVALMVAAVFWTWLWGPMGLLLATPLTVCLVVVGKYVPQLKFLDVLLGDQPALPLGASFHQRLVAGNTAEAAALVREVAKGRGPVEIADVLVLPALRLTRRDRTDGDLSAADETKVLESMASLITTEVSRSDVKAPDSAAESAKLPLVLGCPAHHVAEEIAMLTLEQPADQRRYRVEVASTKLLPVEIEARVRRDQPAVVFISVLPPGGLPQARHLCRRLRKEFPSAHILVGFWGRARNFDKLLVRFRKAGASYVTTSMVQSRNQITAILSARPAPPVAQSEDGLTRGPSDLISPVPTL